jgi:hypothetical protein
MRWRLFNAGSDPVTRYLVRISVDRYPGEPARSNAHHRAHPLTWDQLALSASCDGEAMAWRAQHDRDSFKEVWLCFANERGRFPLYPGQRATLTYAYTVPDTLWGAVVPARGAPAHPRPQRRGGLPRRSGAGGVGHRDLHHL